MLLLADIDGAQTFPLGVLLIEILWQLSFCGNFTVFNSASLLSYWTCDYQTLHHHIMLCAWAMLDKKLEVLNKTFSHKWQLSIWRPFQPFLYLGPGTDTTWHEVLLLVKTQPWPFVQAWWLKTATHQCISLRKEVPGLVRFVGKRDGWITHLNLQHAFSNMYTVWVWQSMNNRKVMGFPYSYVTISVASLKQQEGSNSHLFT